MSKLRSVDAKLARLRQVKNEPSGREHDAAIRDALADKSNFVAAAAAEIVGEKSLTQFLPELSAAFRRFLSDPIETDKLCRAKIAIVEALHKIEANEEDIFRIAIHYVQDEPAWGRSEDTAPPLRAVAAFALVRIAPRDLLVLLSDLLADPEKVARAAAAKALGACGQFAAIPLLRFKCRVGDEESEVIGECLNAILAIDGKDSVPFVGHYLQSSNDEIAEGAAIALAESRRPEALDILKNHWPKARSRSLEDVLLLAIAITRLPAGIDFLVEILANEKGSAPLSALSALAIHRHNPTVRERVSTVVAKNEVIGLRERFEKEFARD